jgi:hypothetical protein
MWINCYEDVNTILFVQSLSEFNEKCYEDNTTNRLRESLKLFDEICNYNYFFNTKIILLFTKIDVFKKKIKKWNLCDFINEYKGKNDFKYCLNFIKNKFLELNKNKNKKIECFECNATDCDSFEKSLQKILFCITGKNFTKKYTKYKLNNVKNKKRRKKYKINLINFRIALNKEMKNNKLIDIKINYSF